MALSKKLDSGFSQLVQKIILCNGRVIVTGVGKSAIIANKIVATLNSTGTPALFMHAADAIHGDLGMVQNGDLVICLSKSGNTPEIKSLIPMVKAAGIFLAAIVGHPDSYLAKCADIILDASVDAEACPHNLAPTTSTTAQLVLGDALAVALLEERQFTTSDFARYHPGGALGKKLYLTLGQLALLNEKPIVKPTASLKEVIIEISKKRLGAAVVLDEDEQILGIITDGDIRRAMENPTKFEKLTAADIMGKHPKSMDKNELATASVELFKSNNITQLLVTDKVCYFGLVHFHDLLKEGII